MQSPPQIPSPMPICVTHNEVELDWTEFINRINSKDAIRAEVSYTPVGNTSWQIAHASVKSTCVISNMKSETRYLYRIRLQNQFGFGPYSEPAELLTLETPTTGSDIHKAVRLNNENELCTILKEGKFKKDTINTSFDSSDNTPLMAAVYNNLQRIVEILLDHDIDVDAGNMLGKTPLMVAAFKGHQEILDLLLKNNADPNKEDKKGYTALFYAVDGEQNDVIRSLVRAGADINYREPVSGATPLIRLASCSNNGNIRVALTLIQHGADFDIQDVNGQSPLIHCAQHSTLSPLAKLLLEKGAAVHLKTKTGYTAQQIAESLKNNKVKRVFETYHQKLTSDNHSYDYNIFKKSNY